MLRRRPGAAVATLTSKEDLGSVCGIAGIAGPPASQLSERIERMLLVQRHRGPDDTGTHLDGIVALGHNRLSILDLTDCGHQPMLIDGGRLAIVFNGEIYNYKEIRETLEAKRHRFFSTSDTEVIARAYDEWGADCTTKFNGMWAFAIYDRDSARLLCSRDRLSVKPFHYAFEDGEFLFSSEIKGILAVRPDLAEVDHTYVCRYLRTSLVNDDQRTFYPRIRTLPAGHSMFVNLHGGKVSLEAPKPYWIFEPDRIRSEYDFTRPMETFRSLLDDSIRLRLRSDVPVGTCLSGGLDSSTIVALATAALDTPLRTFSSIHHVDGFDESRFVDQINATYNTLPYQVEAHAEDLLGLMPRIAWHQDEPSAMHGVFSQWHVMKIVHGQVKVVLDGQGADELLGGYESYFIDAIRSYGARFFADPTHEHYTEWRESIGWARQRLGSSVPKRLLLSYMNEPSKRLVKWVLGNRLESDTNREYLAANASTEDPWAMDRPFGNRLADVTYDSTMRRSIPELLRYEDRNSMAFSIEARVPFLDYRVVEYSLTLPFEERMAGGWTKSVLRRSMSDTLPSEIAWRRDKLGYPTPLALWLRGPFAASVDEFINSPEFRARQMFDHAQVAEMWRRHKAGEGDYSRNVWRWLSLEFWFRAFIDDPKRAAQVPS